MKNEAMKKRSIRDLLLWSSLILILCQALTLYISFLEKRFLEASQIVLPQVSAGLPLAYFFGVVVLFGVILFFIPLDKLRIVLKIMFTFLYSWGTFIIFGLLLPVPASAFVAAAAGLTWFFIPRVWLHDLLLIFTLAAVGSTFGFLLSPWTVILLLLAISVYDILAVRFGYMVWLAKKLSQSETLPAFFIPYQISSWNLSLRGERFRKLLEDGSDERDFSILGGGDIGFPILLMVSVFSAYGMKGSLVVGGFSLIGLLSAYWIQILFLKGKPMPALPPISLLSFIGFLVALVVT